MVLLLTIMYLQYITTDVISFQAMVRQVATVLEKLSYKSQSSLYIGERGINYFGKARFLRDYNINLITFPVSFTCQYRYY